MASFWETIHLLIPDGIMNICNVLQCQCQRLFFFISGLSMVSAKKGAIRLLVIMLRYMNIWSLDPSHATLKLLWSGMDQMGIDSSLFHCKKRDSISVWLTAAGCLACSSTGDSSLSASVNLIQMKAALRLLIQVRWALAQSSSVVCGFTAHLVLQIETSPSRHESSWLYQWF